MILEAVILNVIPNQTEAFESNFRLASSIIRKMKGYQEHELQKCIETENRYLLLVKWDTLEDHTEGFRNSIEYDEWRNLLHSFYEPNPIVEHYKLVYQN